MGAGAPVSAHDNVFNREVTDGHALFFEREADVAACVEQDESNVDAARARGEAGQAHVGRAYRWDDVADRYEALAFSVASCRGRF